MSKTEQNTARERNNRTSRDRIAERLVRRYPGRMFENIDEVFDALDEYDTYVCDHYEKMLGDHNKLTQLMYSNPRVGAFISDIADGEDAVVACIRYFGKELLEGESDEVKLQALNRANEEFMERNKAFRDMEEAMQRNVEKSSRSIERFKRNKGMDELEINDFLERVFHVCRHVFSGDLSEDVLELLHKGLRYDTDLSCAEHAAEIKGRNHSIVMAHRDSIGDALPSTPNNSGSNRKGGYRRFRRHSSVWDM